MGRKRKSGDGTVRLRKDGRWEGRVVIGYDDKGLPKTKNVLAKTKRECEEKLEALKNNIPVRKLLIERNILTAEEVEKVMNPYPMTQPGVPGKDN